MDNIIKRIFRNIFFSRKKSKEKHFNSRKEINDSTKIKKNSDHENDELLQREIKRILDKIELY